MKGVAMNMKLQESLALVAVVAILVGVPAAVWYYESVHRVAELGDGVQVITLTGLSDGGVWTTDAVAGHNYWRTQFDRVESIRIDPSRPVALRLRSADVLHSFSIPALRMRPVEVEPGHEVIVRLTPEDLEGEDELGFLCYQFCGSDHEFMSGALMVSTEPLGTQPLSSPAAGAGGATKAGGGTH